MIRNKKTGKIISGCFVVCEYKDGARFSVKDKPVYDSISKLSEDYEDVKEPIIDDEKIRKVFREWAELYGAERFVATHCINTWHEKTTCFQINGTPMKPVIELPGHIGKNSGTYSREELCGEEE